MSVPHGIEVPTTPRTVDKIKLTLKIAGRISEKLEFIFRHVAVSGSGWSVVFVFCRTPSPAAGAIGVCLAGNYGADAGRLRRLVLPI